MTKTSGTNGTNGPSSWTVELDLAPYADEDGDVTVQLLPPCCVTFHPRTVRSKGR